MSTQSQIRVSRKRWVRPDAYVEAWVRVVVKLPSAYNTDVSSDVIVSSTTVSGSPSPLNTPGAYSLSITILFRGVAVIVGYRHQISPVGLA